MLGSADTPALNPGTETTITIQKTIGGGLATQYILTVADAPTTGKPLGQVTESNELNNAFGVPFDAGKTVPQTFTNPAAK